MAAQESAQETTQLRGFAQKILAGKDDHTMANKSPASAVIGERTLANDC